MKPPDSDVPRRRTVLWIEGLITSGLLAALATYRIWGREWVQRLFDQQGPTFLIVIERVKLHATAEDCYNSGSLFLAILTGLMAIATVVHAFLLRNSDDRLTARIAAAGLTVGFPLVVAATLLVAFVQSADEEPWYPIDQALDLTVDPPFRHRVLFVGVANAIRAAVPGVTNRQAFLWSQFVAALLAVVATQAWCRRLAGDAWSYVGVLLTALMLVPTFQYYTSYDFGIVFFYAWCLTLLFARRYAAYVAVATVAVLNHELILLLMLVSGGIARSQGANWKWVASFVLVQLALYVAVRAILFWLLPVEAAWLPGKVWFNIDRLVNLHYLARSAVLMGWFGLAIAVGAAAARRELRCAIWLLPLLAAMTLLVGQVNEARQFVAFVPVATGLFLARLSVLGDGREVPPGLNSAADDRRRL